MDITGIIDKYKTPFYLYDKESLNSRIEGLKNILSGIGVCYAMKASPILASVLQQDVDKLEICSPGEFEIALRGGIEPSKIIFSGVNKTRESVERVLETAGNDCIFTIESREHFRILKEASEKFDCEIKCYVRLSSGNQFGIDEEEFLDVCRDVVASDNLKLKGLHYFSGTQKKPKKISKELFYLKEFSEKLKSVIKDKITLEYGPGLLYDYFLESDKTGKMPEESARHNLAEIKVAVDESGIMDAFSDVTFEYGRFIAAESAKYYTKAVDIKHTKGSNYVILDGGLHQLNYFGSMAGIKTPYMRVVDSASDGEEEYVLAGSLCSVNDILVRKALLKKLEIGDVIEFSYAGAYAPTESIGLFLSRDIPAILLKKENGDIKKLRGHIESNSLNDGSVNL